MRGDLRSSIGWVSECIHALLVRFMAGWHAEFEAGVDDGLDEDKFEDAGVVNLVFELPACGFLNLTRKYGLAWALVLGLEVGVWG